MSTRLILPVLLSLPVLPLIACGREADPEASRSGPPVVAVSFAPLAWMARTLGGTDIEVRQPLPPDADPAHWTPTPEGIGEFQQADLILVNGAGFETWLDQVSVPRQRIVTTARALRSPLIQSAAASAHSHGGGKVHSHGRANGHTWVDPINAKEQAGAVKEALIGLLPQRAKEIEDRYAALAADLEALSQAFGSLGSLPDGEVFLATHPTYDYLARRHGWGLETVLLEPDRPPTSEALAPLESALEGSAARFLLWEEEPTLEVRDLFQQRFGLSSLVVRPGEALSDQDRQAGRTVLDLWRQNVDALRPAFSPRPDGG